MGIYSECNIDINYNKDADKERIKEFEEEINSNEDIQGNVKGETLFISSGRVQNLKYQGELILDITKEYKDIISNINGIIMIESGDSIYYDPEDQENEE